MKPVKRRELKSETLAQAVVRRRGDMSIRNAAAELGIPFPTLQGIERGTEPKAGLFIKLLAWVGAISPAEAARLSQYLNLEN